MLGTDTRNLEVRRARDRRKDATRKSTFDQIADEADLATLDQVEHSQPVRGVKGNESEDARDDHDERQGYYTPTGRALDGDCERPSVDVEG